MKSTAASQVSLACVLHPSSVQNLPCTEHEQLDTRHTAVLHVEQLILSSSAVWENCGTASIRLTPKEFPRWLKGLLKQLLKF